MPEQKKTQDNARQTMSPPPTHWTRRVSNFFQNSMTVSALSAGFTVAGFYFGSQVMEKTAEIEMNTLQENIRLVTERAHRDSPGGDSLFVHDRNDFTYLAPGMTLAQEKKKALRDVVDEMIEHRREESDRSVWFDLFRFAALGIGLGYGASRTLAHPFARAAQRKEYEGKGKWDINYDTRRRFPDIHIYPSQFR